MGESLDIVQLIVAGAGRLQLPPEHQHHNAQPNSHQRNQTHGNFHHRQNARTDRGAELTVLSVAQYCPSGEMHDHAYDGIKP